MNPRTILPLLLVALAFAGSPALAHKASDSYLTLHGSSTNLVGEWHLALRDLEEAVGLDVNDDGVITWGELRSRQTAVTAYALSRLHLQCGGKEATIVPKEFLVDEHSDGRYTVLRFLVGGINESSRDFEIAYQAFFDLDTSHRGLLRLEVNDAAQLAVFAPGNPAQRFGLGAPKSPGGFASFVKEGLWHIWTGYDHILFLIALLLPGVLRRCSNGWEPVDAAVPAFSNVVKIVTAFTLAHSITLTLAALGLVLLPPRLVEAAIAASVILAALNNLLPFFAERGWMVAFGFGLIHGFGFANALSDLGLHHSQLAVNLLGFNVGVELGQLLIVGIFLPIALGLRHLVFYRRFILRFGSAVIMTLAATWFAERLLDFKWLPF